MSLRVFVSTNFESRALVRALHTQLIALGMTPTATWADIPGVDGEPRRSLAEERAQAAINDHDLGSSHVLLVIGTPRGGEHLCEARLANTLGIPVVWSGRTCLSAYRHGVRIVQSSDEGVELLKRFNGLITKPWATDIDWARDVIAEEIVRLELDEARRFGTPAQGAA